MVLDWDKLIEERNAWVAYNFPDHTGGDPALGSVFGVAEEVGELIHHHLKQDQGIRGGSAFHEKEARDAVGDVSIYLLGVMNHYKVRPVEWNLLENSEQPHQSLSLLKLMWYLGVLADEQAVWRTRVRLGRAVSGIVHWLRVYCKARGWDYAKIVQDTWNHVKQRDWQRYPDTGFPSDDELARVRGESAS